MAHYFGFIILILGIISEISVCDACENYFGDFFCENFADCNDPDDRAVCVKKCIPNCETECVDSTIFCEFFPDCNSPDGREECRKSCGECQVTATTTTTTQPTTTTTSTTTRATTTPLITAPQRCTVPRVPHSNHGSDGDVVFAGDTISYQCDARFTLEGNLVIKCISEGTLDLPKPKCIPPSTVKRCVGTIDKEGQALCQATAANGLCIKKNVAEISCVRTCCEQPGPDICAQYKDNGNNCSEILNLSPDACQTIEPFRVQCLATCCKRLPWVSCVGKKDVIDSDVCKEHFRNGDCREKDIVLKCAATCPCAPEVRCPGKTNLYADFECERLFRQGHCTQVQTLKNCPKTCPCSDNLLVNLDTCFNRLPLEKCEEKNHICDLKTVVQECACTCGKCPRTCPNRFKDDLCEKLQTVETTRCENSEVVRRNCRNRCGLCHKPAPCENRLGDVPCARTFPDPRNCGNDTHINLCAKRCKICGKDISRTNIRTSIKGDLNEVTTLIANIDAGLVSVDVNVQGNFNNVNTTVQIGKLFAFNSTVDGEGNIIYTCIGCKPQPSLPVCPLG